MSRELILEARALTKEFKGFVAVKGVDLQVERGAIHALIGPNGAGKTTVFNLLTRFLDPSAGQIFFNGEEITKEKPSAVARRGVVRSFQICAVLPHLTALENVRLGLQRATGVSYHFWRSARSLDRLNGRARELLDMVDLGRHASTAAVELPYGRKRALELATTLAAEPELMLLDEPTQGMGYEDIGKVTELIRRVSANRTVLMIEHNMSVVASIASKITVLQRGQVLAEGPYGMVSRDPRVREAYMGSKGAELKGH
jgi:branched-chain amino acid transport system ATP-binding protein